MLIVYPIAYGKKSYSTVLNKKYLLFSVGLILGSSRQQTGFVSLHLHSKRGTWSWPQIGVLHMSSKASLYNVAALAGRQCGAAAQCCITITLQRVIYNGISTYTHRDTK